jgi:uncharacterized protein (DUF736 family)
MSTKQIGALWKPKRDSKAVLTGTIDFLGEPIAVGIFKNENKEKDNYPDYHIVRLINDRRSSDDGMDQRPPQDDLPF